MGLHFNHIAIKLAHSELQVDVLSQSQTVGFFAPSGAGKTTLLELVAGLRRADAGRLLLDGRLLHEAATRRQVSSRNRGLGYVPQDGALFPHLSTEQNLYYGRRVDGTRYIDAAEVIDALQIAPLLGRAIARLSGGEKQRVALARALLSAPTWLLLDEPFTGYDATLRARAIDLLLRLRGAGRLSWIIASHELSDLRVLCDEILILEEGQFIVVSAADARPANSRARCSGPSAT